MTGFDEYHPLVRRHAATLAMARWALSWIESRGADLFPAGIDAGLTRDSDGVIEEFDGFFTLPDRVVGRGTPIGPLLFRGKRATEDRLVKQADIVLMMAALPHCFDKRTLAVNLDYYGERTAHESSLSPAAHGAVAAQVGRPDAALAWIRAALRYNLDFEPRTQYRNGVHLAALAAAKLALIEGCLGLRLRSDSPAVNFASTLPKGIHSLTGTIWLRGHQIRFAVSPRGLEVEAASASSASAPDRFRCVLELPEHVGP